MDQHFALSAMLVSVQDTPIANYLPATDVAIASTAAEG